MSLKIEMTTEAHLANVLFFDDWQLKRGLHHFELLEIDSSYRKPSWRQGGKRGTARFVINDENLATLNRLAEEFKMTPVQILIAITHDMYSNKGRRWSRSFPPEIRAPREPETHNV